VNEFASSYFKWTGHDEIAILTFRTIHDFYIRVVFTRDVRVLWRICVPWFCSFSLTNVRLEALLLFLRTFVP